MRSREQTLRWWLIAMLLVLLVPCLAAGVGILYHHYLYASYQRTQCTILDKGVQVSSDGTAAHKKVYAPLLTYSVDVPGGGRQTVSGYSGPAHIDFPYTADSADTTADEYQVHEVYTCWYSAIAQPHAVLVLQDYPADRIMQTFWVTLFVGAGLLFVAASVFYLGFYTAGWPDKPAAAKQELEETVETRSAEDGAVEEGEEARQVDIESQRAQRLRRALALSASLLLVAAMLGTSALFWLSF